MNRRDQIAMAPREIADFLDEQRICILATNGRDGWPHLMPLWYIVRAEQLWAWTFAKSQKVRNLERDPRSTVQIEDGEEYHVLRGVMVQAATVIHRDLSLVTEIGTEIFRRYTAQAVDEGSLDAVRAQAAKRVALQFVPSRIVSWDHRKLAGVY